MIDIKTPEVTEDDVLKGTKNIPVRTRTGQDKTIAVKAPNWRVALQACALIEQGNHYLAAVTVLKEQGAPLCEDAFLDNLPPAFLPVIVQVALQLANGVDEAKKRTAKPEGPGIGSSSPVSAS